MKKVIIITLVIAMSLCLFACGAKDKTEEPQVAGGWTDAEDTTVSEELAGLLAKAAEAKNDGASYEPVKLVATQVVAGTNYKILCNVTEAGGAAAEKVVTLYVDLEKNAEITDVSDAK